MSDSVVILLDSSDEEAPPKKKLKSDTKDDFSLTNVQIKNVRTLNDNDVVIIEDDDSSETKQSAQIKIGSNSKSVAVENETVKRITLTKVDSKPKTVLTEIPSDTDADQQTEDTVNNVESETSDNNKDNSELQDEGVSSTNNQIFLPEFEDFITTCLTFEENPKYKDVMQSKVSKFRTKYMETEEGFVESISFKNLLINSINLIKKKPINTIVYFEQVYKELATNRKSTISLSEKEEKYLRKLERFMEKIIKKIKYLDEAECDWEDEDNSAYVKAERYKIRASLIYKKICSITKQNPYAGRQIYKSLELSASSHPEINRYVDKCFAINVTFPAYCDIDKCVRECVQKHNLNISGPELDREIKKIFKNVGDVLQRRRRYELYESLVVNFDAVENIVLSPDKELEMNKRYKESQNKIDTILTQYTNYQEQGREPENLSPDTDDSNYESENQSN